MYNEMNPMAADAKTAIRWNLEVHSSAGVLDSLYGDGITVLSRENGAESLPSSAVTKYVDFHPFVLQVVVDPAVGELGDGPLRVSFSQEQITSAVMWIPPRPEVPAWPAHVRGQRRRLGVASRRWGTGHRIGAIAIGIAGNSVGAVGRCVRGVDVFRDMVDGRIEGVAEGVRSRCVGASVGGVADGVHRTAASEHGGEKE